jgi:ribosome biogenesis GTPase A
MHLTRKAIGERVKEIDVVIEMLDARLPGSSANPLMAELTSGRPTLKVLNKQDMADPVRTQLWLDHYNAQPNTRAIALDASDTAPARALIDACFVLAPKRGGMVKPMRVLICGIPNVGKSTLINTLKGKRAAKTGDEAGVTRTESRIALADDFYLYDTPGMLWPKIDHPIDGLMMAASHSVGVNAYIDDEVATWLAGYLLEHYPALLQARYGFDLQGMDAVAILEGIAKKRGCIIKGRGGELDIEKAAGILLNDYRTGTLGRITLETPTLREARARQLAEAAAVNVENQDIF